MKTYCKNCKYQGYWSKIGMEWDWCESPENGYYESNEYVEDFKSKNLRAVLKTWNNKDGNCKFYKEKFNIIKWIKQLLKN